MLIASLIAVKNIAEKNKVLFKNLFEFYNKNNNNDNINLNDFFKKIDKSNGNFSLKNKTNCNDDDNNDNINNFKNINKKKFFWLPSCIAIENHSNFLFLNKFENNNNNNNIKCIN
jgi:hypothetical protein